MDLKFANISWRWRVSTWLLHSWPGLVSHRFSLFPHPQRPGNSFVSSGDTCEVFTEAFQGGQLGGLPGGVTFLVLAGPRG